MVWYNGGESIGDDDAGSGIGSDDIYKESAKSVLVSLSNLYSDKSILISTSRPSSYPILHCLLTTYSTNYCLNQTVCNFDLRKLFYSRQDFKSTCCFSANTGYKEALQHKVTTMKKLSNNVHKKYYIHLY